MKKVLIIGATSAMACACARLWAKDGAQFYLAARSGEKLQQVADDLIVLGAAGVQTLVLDLNDFKRHEELVTGSFAALGQIEIALIAQGTLPNQADCEASADLTLQEFTTNALSVISLLTLLAGRFEAQHFGCLAVIASVAADRGRPSNYVYGAAKAAVTTFCQGLRARLFKSGVNLLTIKPGFVATPMTQGLALPAKLVATPEKVAEQIVLAVERKQSELYTPGFWFWIMLIIRSIPEFIFKRLKL